jgi:calmodulin
MTARAESESEEIGMTRTQIAEYREAFYIFDEDNDGLITWKELEAIMRALGQNPTEADFREWMHRYDPDDRGTINFDSFLSLMAKHIRDSNPKEEITDAFRVFDREGNGKITIAEFTHILRDIGDPLSQREIDEMVEEAQAGPTGEIDYVDFINRMVSS